MGRSSFKYNPEVMLHNVTDGHIASQVLVVIKAVAMMEKHHRINHSLQGPILVVSRHNVLGAMLKCCVFAHNMHKNRVHACTCI